jgi:hypothetical protein
MRVIGKEEDELVKKATSIDQCYFTSMMNFDSAYAALALVVGLISFFYCRSLVVGVREAMASMKETPIGAAAPSRVRTAGGDAARKEPSRKSNVLRDTAIVVGDLILLILAGGFLFGYR